MFFFSRTFMLFCFVLTNAEDATSRFKSAKSISLNPNICTIAYCYTKTNSNASYFNWGFILHRPLSKPIYVKFDIGYKYGSVYRTVFRSPTIEWCALMEDKDPSLAIKMAVDILRAAIPQYFHKCPYKGRVDLKNVTYNDSKWLSLIPAGLYKVDLVAEDAESKLLNMQLIFEIKSNVKSNF